MLSKGSSTSLRCWSRRMSLENFEALWAMPDRVDRIMESSLRDRSVPRRETGVIPHLFGDDPVQLPAFFMIALKQLEETCLGAGGSLWNRAGGHGRGGTPPLRDPSGTPAVQRGRPFAHSGGLRRLEMGEGQGGDRLVFVREPGEQGDGAHQLFSGLNGARHTESSDRCCPHIAARRPEMDDPLALGHCWP